MRAALLAALAGGQPRLTRATSATIEANTIVTGDTANAHWQFTDGTTVASATGTPTYAILNNEQATDTPMIRAHQFVAPPGSSQVTVAYTVRTGQDSDSGNQVQVAVMSRDLTSTITADTARTLTDTPTPYSFDAAVTAGTEYAVVIYLANATIGTGNRCRVSAFSVSIDAGTGVFASTFYRIAVDADSLDLCSPTTPPAYEQNAFVRGTELSRVRLRTDAAELAVEYRLNLRSGHETYGDIGLWEEYKPTDHIATSSSAQAYIGTLTRTDTGRKVVDVVNGYQQVYRPVSTTDILSSMARAIYVSDSAVTVWTTRPEILIYGSSIICSRGPESPCNEGVPVQLRGQNVDAACIGWGSSRLQDSCGDDSARATWAAFMVSFGAHVYWINHGVNDYVTTPTPAWSAADFGAAYGDLVDKIKALDPKAKVYCQNPIPFDGSTPNTFGDTLDDYRDQIQAVAAARSFCSFPDFSSGVVEYTDDYYSDNIHLTSASIRKLGDAIRAELPQFFSATAPILVEAEAEYQCDDGDIFALVDSSGNHHHGQFGSGLQADANDPAWNPAGYLDIGDTKGMKLPATYTAAIGTGALTLLGVAKTGTINYGYIFGSDAPGDHIMIYTQGTTRKWAFSANPAKANDTNVVGADEWHFVLGVYEPSTRVTLWTTATGALSKVAEVTASVPASMPSATGNYMGNDVRFTHGLPAVAFAAAIVGAVADADVPSIYARVKAAMAARPTPIVLP